MTSLTLPVFERPAVPGDMGLVYDSWLRSYQFRVGEAPSGAPCPTCHRGGKRDISGGQANAEMRTGDYFLQQRQRIDRLLETRGSIVVLHPEGTPNVVYAWVCVDEHPSVFHYVYTAANHRKRGYAKRLIGTRDVCTHMTNSLRPDSFAAWKRRAGFVFAPYILDASWEG